MFLNLFYESNTLIKCEKWDFGLLYSNRRGMNLLQFSRLARLDSIAGILSMYSRKNTPYHFTYIYSCSLLWSPSAYIIHLFPGLQEVSIDGTG